MNSKKALYYCFYYISLLILLILLCCEYMSSSSHECLTNFTPKCNRCLTQRQLPPLSETERFLYELIKSKQNLGIRTADLKRDTGLQTTVVTKTLKSLQNKSLISVNKARKIYMAVVSEPSKEKSGGSWYSDGRLDTDFIRILREQCLKHIERLQVATVEAIYKSIQESGVFKVECTMQQIVEIVNVMVLDKEVEELKSAGIGDFSEVQSGKICYRSLKGREGPKIGAFSSIPCGVCPQMSECTPEGIISPKTCIYYNKWLKMEF